MKEKLQIFLSFFTDLFRNRKMFADLVQNDMKSRYAGNLFGMIWAYIQPLVNLLVMWFVFQYGFRNSPVDDIEFILWYLAANVPWLFFSDAVSSASNCLYEYGYLVKKVRFRTSMLPLVKVFSAGFIHVFLMFFVVFMFEIYGYQPQWMWLQIIYYSFAELCLLAGLSWLIASVSVFMKDFAQLINIVISILFCKTLGIYEKDSGRAVICDIGDFPFTLIWSKPGTPRFVCIEPWNSLPSPEDGGSRWEEKPAAAELAPGERWSTTLRTTFAR